MKRLPLNTGPYKVGCCDVITKFGMDRLFFRLFYPTAANLEFNDTTLAKWISDYQYAMGFCDFLNIKLFSRPFYWLTSSMKVNAVWNGSFKLPKELKKIPIVIFSHGLGAIEHATVPYVQILLLKEFW